MVTSCLFITLIKCLKGLKPQRSLFVSNILKWQSVSHPATKVRYRAARAAKNTGKTLKRAFDLVRITHKSLKLRRGKN